MKYKLIGEYLDNVKVEYIDHQNFEIKDVQNADIKFNLFDIKTYKRKAKATKLLEISCLDELNNFTNKIKYCDVIYIEKDFFIDNSYVIVKDFYEKRINQIATLIQQRCTNSRIIIIDNFSCLREA